MTKEVLTRDARDFCQFPRCHDSLSTIIWLGVGLCDKHWVEIAEMNSKEAQKKLKIK